MRDLPAGRELDALIAARVFGLVRCTSTCHKNPERGDGATCYAFPESSDQGGELREYSTDIAAAWEVVEKLREMVASVRAGSLVITPYAYPQVSGDEWCVMHNYDGYDGRHDARWRVSAKTAPHAICLAALQVLGSEGRTA